MQYCENIIVNSLSIKNLTNKINKNLLKDKIVKISYYEKNYEHFFLQLSQKIGTLMPMEENIKTGNKTGNLFVDIKYAKNKSNSFLHSNTRQPFHTDGSYESNPPDLTFFFCKKQAKYGGSTIFINNKDLIKICKCYNFKMYQHLISKKLSFFKGNDKREKEIIDKKLNLNWNYFRVEKTPLVEDFHAFLEHKIFDGGLYENINLKEGEGIIFNDNKFLHGRTSFIGNRWLKKGGIKWILK